MNVLKKSFGWLKAKKQQTQAFLATLFLSMAVAGQIHAALPQSVQQALDGAKADGLEAGWLVVGVAAALFVIAIVKRLLR